MAIYNLPSLYRVSKSPISIERLRRTLRQMTGKHAVLRTSVQLDLARGHLTQHIHPNDGQDWFGFEISVIDNRDELKPIFHDETTNRSHFDVGHGRVFRCHIVRQHQSTVNDDDVLLVDDWIIFNFHHIAFDGESEPIFLADLQQFYDQQQQRQDSAKQDVLQYIDCKS